MTAEEAIRILAPETTFEALTEIEYYGGFNGERAQISAVNEACRLAVAALRVQQEMENPKPLTLKQLRQMNGEPVWCVSLKNEKSEYAILRIVEMSRTWYIAVSGASAGYGDKDTYGKTWLAYRHKPEVATK